MKAFFELSTCRSIGLSIGPIPWLALQQYCSFKGLDYEASCILIRGVQVLDSAYLGIVKERSEKKSNA